MARIQIEGGTPLVGDISVSGSKKLAFRLIAASLFSNEDVILENVPRINAVTDDLEIVEALGAKVEWQGQNRLCLNGAGINTYEIPQRLGCVNRTAALYAMALLFRFGKAVIPFPGECALGPRPINRWVAMWESLGIKVTNDAEKVHLDASSLNAGNVSFQMNTHLGTDLAILLGSFMNGTTVVNNAAEEPETDYLVDFINMIGGKAKRTEPRRIEVEGTKQFTGGVFKLCPDINEVVLYSVGALVSGGNITIKGVIREHVLAFTNLLTKIGAKFDISGDELRVWCSDEDMKSVDVTTAPYPGFMSDWQPLITLLYTKISGKSFVHDTIYWDRFSYTVDLNRMGAKIELVTPAEAGVDVVVSDDTYDLKKMGEPKSVASVNGGTSLQGVKMQIACAPVSITLILAAISADGKSEFVGFENIEEWYEDLVEKLQKLGANIETIQ